MMIRQTRAWQGAAFIGLIVAAAGVRAEPPKELQVVVEAERGEYFVGEPVILKMGVKNVSEKVVKIGSGGDYRGGTRPHRFVVTATDEKGVKAIDPDPVQMMFGGLGGDRDIAPGETVWAMVPPMRYCLIDKPGTYTFWVGHDLKSSTARLTEAMKPENLVHGEITLRFKMPNEAEAAKIVDTQMTMIDRGWMGGFSQRPDADIGCDPVTLRLPVYLKSLQKYAEAGKPEAVVGIGSIETPEATKLLIEILKRPEKGMAEQAVWALQKRLPGSQDPKGWAWAAPNETAAARYAGLIKATWRPEFGPELRALSVEALEKGTNLTGDRMYDTLYAPAYFLEMIGEEEDAPVVLEALDRALERDDRDVRSMGEARNVGSLVRAAKALIVRGAAAPDSKRPGAAVLEMHRIMEDPKFRPEGWQARLAARLGDPRAYLRLLTLQALVAAPEALTDDAKAKLADLLRDTDVAVRNAAIPAVGKSGDRALGAALLEVLRTATDQEMLRSGGYAMEMLPQRGEWLEICAARLNEAGKWDALAPSLVGTLDGLSGGGTSGQPSGADAAVAQKLWVAFVSKHKEELAAGKKIALEEAVPRMLPPPYSLSLKSGGTWPKRP